MGVHIEAEIEGQISQTRHQAEERNQQKQSDNDMNVSEEHSYSSVARPGDKKGKVSGQRQEHQQYQLKKKATAPQGKFKCFNDKINEKAFEEMAAGFLNAPKQFSLFAKI